MKYLKVFLLLNLWAMETHEVTITPTLKSPLMELSYSVTITTYAPTKKQCGKSFAKTADGSKINMKHPAKHRWCAVSRDLEKIFKLGDTIRVTGTWVYDGLWVVHDRTSKRLKSTIDLLVGVNDYQDKWIKIGVKRAINSF